MYDIVAYAKEVSSTKQAYQSSPLKSYTAVNTHDKNIYSLGVFRSLSLFPFLGDDTMIWWRTGLPTFQ
jgi:hypothetical protein